MSDAVARKRYSAEFKRHAVAQLDGCTNVTALAARLGIRRKFLYAWRDSSPSSAKPRSRVVSAGPQRRARPH